MFVDMQCLHQCLNATYVIFFILVASFFLSNLFTLVNSLNDCPKKIVIYISVASSVPLDDL